MPRMTDGDGKGTSRKGVQDGTGFDGFPPESEGLTHYSGDEANKLRGVVNDTGTGAHGGSGGEGGSRTTPLGKRSM